MELEVKSPYDKTQIATLAMHNDKDIEQMLDAASSLYKNKKNWLSIEKRCDILHSIEQLMKENSDFLALQIAKEGGKPLSDAQVEVARAIDGIQVCRDHLRTRSGEEIPMGLNEASRKRLAVTRFEPIGVVVAISAFNHPLNLIVHQVAPAIAAGCPVIIKPASSTPLSAKSFVEFAHRSGLPAQWCQLCLVSGKSAEKLASDPRVNFLSFIGSSDVGWMLRSKLAPGTRCALEHGGIAPVFIDESANVEKLLPKLVKAGYYHAGQVCVSAQRVYIPSKMLSNFTEQLCEQVKRLKVGDPTLAETDVGPLIQEQEVKRVHDWLNEAIKAGAQCPIGGKILSSTVYAPTIIVSPSRSAKVLNHELFGPSLILVGYNQLSEAIEQANDVPYSFQASIFSENITTALNASEDINAAAVMINDHPAFRVDWMPFAGYKESGHGIGGIPYTMDEMSCKKLTVFNYD